MCVHDCECVPMQPSMHAVVMLTDIMIGLGCVLQLLSIGFSGLQADLKVLSSIQSPHAPLLQDLCQPQERHSKLS